jgi:hypothetical protein
VLVTTVDVLLRVFRLSMTALRHRQNRRCGDHGRGTALHHAIKGHVAIEYFFTNWAGAEGGRGRGQALLAMALFISGVGDAWITGIPCG